MLTIVANVTFRTPVISAIIHSVILIQAARPIKHTDNRQTDKHMRAITRENICKPKNYVLVFLSLLLYIAELQEDDADLSFL